MNEVESLRQEVAELRQQIDGVDDWANGIQQVLVGVLPFLLRGHPEAGKVEELLRNCSDRYDRLLEQPELAESLQDSPEMLEAGKILYWQLAILGVWPGIDSATATQQALARLGQSARVPRTR